MKILKDSYKEAKRLLKDNRRLMDKLAEFLIEKETITGKEFMEIFRKEKGIQESGSVKKTADSETEDNENSDKAADDNKDKSKETHYELPDKEEGIYSGAGAVVKGNSNN